MKRYHLLGWLSAGLIFTFTPRGLAADEGSGTTAASVSTETTAAQTPPVTVARVAYGVDDILKLRRAQISEDVIATYIQTSGTVYTLRPGDIVQLHSQGVSDRIITLMLAQGRTEPTNTPVPVMPVMPIADATAAPAYAQASANDPGLFIPGQNAVEIAAACQPVVQDAPSTLYIIPNSGSCGYRSAYTYYGGCYPTYRYGYGYGSGYGYVPSYTVRLGGGHHYRSFCRR